MGYYTDSLDAGVAAAQNAARAAAVNKPAIDALAASAASASSSASSAAVDAASAASSAAASATSSANSAALVGAPAGAAVDARLSGGLGFVVAASASYADVQAALDDAAANGKRALAYGTITTSSTLLIKGDCDLSQLTINYTGSGVAVQIGDPAAGALLLRKDIRLGVILATNKSGLGWAGVAGTTGLRVSSAYSCFIRFARIASFETGFWGHSQSPQGTSYCQIELGHIDNCMVSIKLAPQSTGTTAGDKTTSGWFNQNTFLGGRCSHNSNEGVQVAGTRNILISPCGNSVNNNVWLNTAIESPDVAEYHIEMFGQYNYFDRCRFENTGGDAHRRIWWRSDGNAAGSAKGNIINGGFNAGNVTEVRDAGIGTNDIRADTFQRYTSGNTTNPTVILENPASSSAPMLIGMAAGNVALGTNPLTGYSTKLTANTWAGKRTADSFDRLVVDFQNGRFYPNDGTAAPVGYIGGQPTLLYVGGGVPFAPLTTGAQDLGISALKWRNVYVSGAVGFFGATPPAAKPAVTGSRGGNAALASLLTALASYGLITDSTTA